jgi:acetyltransferase-like isoleucine patch superfamily enzyme
MNVGAREVFPLTAAGQRDEPGHELGELQSCRGAGWFMAFYTRLKGPGSSFVRRQLLRLLTALEGGPMRSATLRRIMQVVHGIDAGAHAYGCFDPVRFPPGTHVGRYASIGPGVWAFRRNHPHDRLSMHPYFYHPSLGAVAGADVETAPLSIGAGSWIGAQVIILPGCRRIGRGAVVAAGAVLTRDVPDYAIAGGNPARLIKYRFSVEDMAAANATRWWDKLPADVEESFEMSLPWACEESVH